MTFLQTNNKKKTLPSIFSDLLQFVLQSNCNKQQKLIKSKSNHNFNFKYFLFTLENHKKNKNN